MKRWIILILVAVVANLIVAWFFERRKRKVADKAELARLRRLRADRQHAVRTWMVDSFGEAESLSLPQRGLRLLEEAAETAQSTGVTLSEAQRLMEYVWGRPAGSLHQELGGVGVTLLALASVAGLSADQCEADEVQRILSKPKEHWHGRNKAKNDAGLKVQSLSDPVNRKFEPIHVPGWTCVDGYRWQLSCSCGWWKFTAPGAPDVDQIESWKEHIKGVRAEDPKAVVYEDVMSHLDNGM